MDQKELGTCSGLHAKEIWKNYSVKKTGLLLQLNRDEIRKIVGFTTGHGGFKAHLKKMNIVTDNKCKYCEKDETAKHIMCDCDAYAILRQNIVGKMYCELKEYSRLNFQDYHKFCTSAFERISTQMSE